MSPVSSKWVVLWSLWAARLVPLYTPALRLHTGLVRGVIAPDGSHAAYTGIPYASVTERFQAASPVREWDGIYTAQDENIRCTQRFSSSKVLGVEDCLRLNVYTPLKVSRTPLLPVMVFVHGGGFRDGSGTPFIYGPEYLIRHGVILVTFNYRLEVLGFLCLGIKEAPGNAGLKDQVAALKWVKENIKVFGGDPDNVTVFGESAGSASVMYHLVSPMSKGLFHKAIMQSGSAISPWSMQFEPLQTAYKLAPYVNSNVKCDSPEELYNLFRNVSAGDLMKARVPRSKGDIVLSENIFVPCVEKPLPGEATFLPDIPYNLIIKRQFNKVPVIIGYNSAEGYMFAGKENNTILPQLDFYGAIPRDLHIPDDGEKRRIADVFKRYYMGDKSITKETLVQFAGFEGDSSITYPVVFTSDLLVRHSTAPVYAYRFHYDGWMNLAKITFGFGKYPGATHADELFYMFKIKVTLFLGLLESDFTNRLTTLWTNFAKYGNPTPEVSSTTSVKWEPASGSHPQVLNIGDQFSTSPLWNDDIITFWNTTYTKYRRKTIESPAAPPAPGK